VIAPLQLRFVDTKGAMPLGVTARVDVVKETAIKLLVAMGQPRKYFLTAIQNPVSPIRLKIQLKYADLFLMCALIVYRSTKKYLSISNGKPQSAQSF